MEISRRQTFKLLPELFGDGEMAEIFSAERTVLAWLRTEAALARAQAEAGVIGREDAAAIAAACVPANIDIPRLWSEAVNNTIVLYADTDGNAQTAEFMITFYNSNLGTVAGGSQVPDGFIL